MVRHGSLRILQKENQKSRIIGFKESGVSKKINALSLGQLRNMFPFQIHLSEKELRKLAFEKFSKK